MKADTPAPWDQVDWPSLLDAARLGDSGALGEVFERLYSYCCMVAGNRLSVDLAPKVGASDIAQKSLLEAFAKIHSFPGHTEADIQSWLATIVHHNVIDAARHYRTAGRQSEDREIRLDSPEAATTIPSPCQPPSFAMRRQEEDVELYRAVAQLSENQRRVVELRFRDGLDYRQIAAAMDLSEVAARKLCSRAIETLRKLLAAQDESRISRPN